MSRPQAFDSIQKAVGADGTTLHDLESEQAIEVAGPAGSRRDYTGSARGMDRHITLVLVRHDSEDILLRAVWTRHHDALFALLVAASIESWDPRVKDQPRRPGRTAHQSIRLRRARFELPLTSMKAIA